MSENPELDPYRPPRTLEPDASSARPPAWSVALRRMAAFLDSPRRAMRDVLRVYGWAAVPQVVTLVLLVAYLLLSFTSILQPTDSSRFTHTLAGGLLLLLGVVMGLLQLSICVIGLSEASGKTVGRSAWWLVVSVVLGFGCALLLVQASFRLLFG